MEQDLEKVARDIFYLNAEMIKFLLIENLALKLTLHNQGILNSEEFAKYKKDATEILEKQAFERIEEWKKLHPHVSDVLSSVKREFNHSEVQPVVS